MAPQQMINNTSKKILTTSQEEPLMPESSAVPLVMSITASATSLKSSWKAIQLQLDS